MKSSIKQYKGYSLKALRSDSKAFGVVSILSTAKANPKLVKNQKIGVLSFPLHLAPHKLSGHNVCPSASKGCIKACLHTAGNVQHMQGKNRARIARTKLFFSDRDLFCALLIAEIHAANRKANREGMLCGIRLNATSDICWENLKIDGFTLFELFPEVSFYDYTKIPDRTVPSNYHLTFSLSESNKPLAFAELKRGRNVAVVLDLKRLESKPVHWLGFGMIDGDIHDYRPADGDIGQWIGIHAKGLAKTDASGFVYSI